ncbi:receptor-like protein EIX2 [Prosopis cineraria]|uniref:receptor-like protein EIX2 n=1 Tax=Prosopis cineraria TaxID=364024 RepID=UPI0024103194|nr:receptor-like protein EIX2 [Prosopis cineraria]
MTLGGLPLMDGYEIPLKFKTNLHTKGQQLEYGENLGLVQIIDFSTNKLCGEIPGQLFGLKELQSLNLSYNDLTGEISERIGEMKNLESLDFSHNNLHRNIPLSMSSLSFLSHLNLSYNDFKGQIPLATQLESFDAWSYIGNPELYGAPLQKNCTIHEKVDNNQQVGGNNEDDTFLKSLYLGMGVGFAVGFWIICVTFDKSNCCNDNDRILLLIFKQGVVDPSNLLSSWSTKQDCCQWLEVECDRNTSRVKTLVLPPPDGNLHGSEFLRGEINLSSLLALEFLESLDLSYNDFERLSTPSMNNSDVAHSHLPANFSKLSELSLSNNIHLHIDDLHWLSQLSSLTTLDLESVHLPLETSWVQSLASLPLKRLYLRDCHLNSFILSSKNVNFSSVSVLDLSLNEFRYGLPDWLFNLSKDCDRLYLKQCNLRGPIPDFSVYRNLLYLDLSSNNLQGTIPDWLGQLEHLYSLHLSNNSFHGFFPSNLGNSSALSSFDISFNNLSGTLPKSLEQTAFMLLDLSHNSFNGDISKLLLKGYFISMSFNKFEGQLPRISPNVIVLDLAHNSFSGSLSSLLCDAQSGNNFLYYLDISNNFLTGELPDCWNNWANLSHIYLGSNMFSGEVPPTMGSSLLLLSTLDLHNNGFFGDIPQTFQYCMSLVLINLEGNNFSGKIPEWTQQNISVVKLRSNQFIGIIPPQLCSLSNLIVLDLADNQLSGSIPPCLNNLTSLALGLLPNALITKANDLRVEVGLPISYEYRAGLYTKGQLLEYERSLKLVRNIDLSANKLSGEIPVQLLDLHKLQSLNLSHNHLIGKIPEQMGGLKDLESLDFSHNRLHGNIPKVCGQIPWGTQLQSFEAWSYAGNPELCGAPLQNNCTIQENPNNTKQVEENDDDTFLKSLYLGMGLGFAGGFWIVCGSVLLIGKWRHAYFRFFTGLVDRIYVTMAIKLRRLR